MVNTNFLSDYRVKSLVRFNEKYAFVMMIIFSLMPIFAIFSPPSFGPLFTGIAQLEIYSFLILGIFQLVSYASFSSRRYPLGERMKLCFVKLKDCLLNNKAGLIILAAYALAVVSALKAENTERAFYGTEFRPDGLRMYTCFLVVYVYSTLVKKPSLRKGIFAVNIVGFVLTSLIIIQQYYGIIGSAGVKDGGAFGAYLSSIYDGWGMRYGHFYKGFTGPFYNLNHSAYYITIGTMLVNSMLIMAKTRASKILLSLLSLFAYFTLIANDTFGCYLAVLATTIIVPAIIIVKDKERSLKKTLNVFLPLILFICMNIAFFVASPDANPITKNFVTLGKDVETVATSENIEEEHAGSGRLEMWLATFKMIKEKPLLGYGPDNLKSRYVELGVDLDRAHNEPLEKAVATGIPSAVIFYAGVAYALFVFIRKRDFHKSIHELAPFMAVVAYLVSSLFGVFLFYTGGFFIMMFAFVASGDKMEYQIEAKTTKKQ